MFFLNLCHLFLDNEEDETTNVMDNARDFASSFASEQLQGDETFLHSLPQQRTPPHSPTHTVKNNTQPIITLLSLVVPSRHHLVFCPHHLFPSRQHKHKLLHQTKIVTLQLLLQHINMLEPEKGE